MLLVVRNLNENGRKSHAEEFPRGAPGRRYSRVGFIEDGCDFSRISNELHVGMVDSDASPSRSHDAGDGDVRDFFGHTSNHTACQSSNVRAPKNHDNPVQVVSPTAATRAERLTNERVPRAEQHSRVGVGLETNFIDEVLVENHIDEVVPMTRVLHDTDGRTASRHREMVIRSEVVPIENDHIPTANLSEPRVPVRSSQIDPGLSKPLCQCRWKLPDQSGVLAGRTGRFCDGRLSHDVPDAR